MPHFGEPVSDRASEPMEERPIQTYAEQNGRPLVADMLDIGSMYKHLGMDGEITAIDKYILSEIADRDLKPNSSSYNSIYYELEGKLGLDPNLNVDTIVGKVATLAEALQRIKYQEQLRKMLNV